MNILIKNIGQLVSVVNDQKPYLRGTEMNEISKLNNAWLLIKGEKILKIGTGSLPSADKEIDIQGACVVPAFADSHSHLVYAGNREGEFVQRLQGVSYEQIAKQGGGILNSALALQNTSEEELYEQSAYRLKQLMQMGTGALEIKSGYGLTTESELKMLRVARKLGNDFPVVIKTSFLGAHALPVEYKERREDYIDLLLEEMLPRAVEENLVDFIDVFCESGYFSLDETLRIVEAARAYNLPAKIHINQFNSLGGIKPLVDRGALSLDHLEVLENEELHYLADSNTIATALPGCSLFLKIPYTPSRKIIDAGGILALATDFNPGSAPSGNMALAQSLACTQMKLTPDEALASATINGAAAMELSDQIGSIEEGKLANFLVLSKGHSSAAIPYHFGHHLLERVFLKGREINL